MNILARTPAVAAAAVAAVAFTAPAFAQAISSRPELPAMQIATQLIEQGYHVLEIERDDGRYEVKAFDSNGACVELDVDRRSGDVLRTKADDDCAAGGPRRNGAR